MNIILDDLSIFKRRIKKMNKAVFWLHILYILMIVVVVLSPLCILGAIILSYYCHHLVVDIYGRPAYRKRLRRCYKDVEKIINISYCLNMKSLAVYAEDFDNAIIVNAAKDEIVGHYNFESYEIRLYVNRLS